MIKKLAALCLTLSAAAFSLGQNPDAFDYHCADFRLLTSKKVQADMKVTTAQVKLMNTYADQNRTEINNYRQLLAKQGKQLQENDPQLQKYFVELQQAVLTQLTPGQLKRLRELTLQSVGLTGMLDGAVAKRIGLTTAQLDKAKKIFETGVTKERNIRKSAYDKVMAPYKNVTNPTEAEAKKLTDKIEAAFKVELTKHQSEITAVAKQTKAGIEGVISKKQLDAYAALGGKKFEVK